jgi:hypothetical protein
VKNIVIAEFVKPDLKLLMENVFGNVLSFVKLVIKPRDVLSVKRGFI